MKNFSYKLNVIISPIAVVALVFGSVSITIKLIWLLEVKKIILTEYLKAASFIMILLLLPLYDYLSKKVPGYLYRLTMKLILPLLVVIVYLHLLCSGYKLPNIASILQTVFTLLIIGELWSPTIRSLLLSFCTIEVTHDLYEIFLAFIQWILLNPRLDVAFVCISFLLLDVMFLCTCFKIRNKTIFYVSLVLIAVSNVVTGLSFFGIRLIKLNPNMSLLYGLLDVLTSFAIRSSTIVFLLGVEPREKKPYKFIWTS